MSGKIPADADRYRADGCVGRRQLTEALPGVYTIMSCNRTVVVDPSAISWGAIGKRLGICRRLVGDCILSVCFWLQKLCNFVKIGRQPIGDWSAISRRLKLCRDCLQPLQLVGDQSPTSRRPVGDHQKPFYDRFGRREVSLAATKTSLRPNRPCNLLQQVGDQSPTSLQPPCNLPATTRNFGCKEVADRLQAMCDRGFSYYHKFKFDPFFHFFFLG